MRDASPHRFGSDLFRIARGPSPLFLSAPPASGLRSPVISREIGSEFPEFSRTGIALLSIYEVLRETPHVPAHGSRIR